MRLRFGFALLLSLMLLSACVKNEIVLDEYPVNHIVLLWLKDDVSTSLREDIFKKTTALSEIPGVANLRIGKVISSDRKIVDDSFDFGISMNFRSVDEMNTYLQHPQHVGFVNQYIKPNIKKIKVYDF